MTNSAFLIGRLKETKQEGNKFIVTLICPRTYKNSEGQYDVDYIDIILYNDLKSNVRKYCRENDLMGIKGRIETEDNKIILIAEKVTFLSTKEEKKEELE